MSATDPTDPYANDEERTKALASLAALETLATVVEDIDLAAAEVAIAYVCRDGGMSVEDYDDGVASIEAVRVLQVEFQRINDSLASRNGARSAL